VRGAASRGGGLHVLRLCSVFEPVAGPASAADGHLPGELEHRAARFDPIGGMQNHTAALTGCLDQQGHRQTIVTSRLAGPRGRTVLGHAATVHRTGLPVRGLRQLWAWGAFAAVLWGSALRRPLDVVHAHQGEDLAVLLLARLAARRHGSPLVVTVHCSVGHTFRGRSLRQRLFRVVGAAVERSTLRKADAIIVLTEHTAAALRADGVPPDRISVIASGFDPRLFAEVRSGSTDLFPELDRPRIGYVGRLAAQKGVASLVSAFGAMREQAELVLVGDGPERDRIVELVSGSPDHITMHGFVEHSIVPRVLASLDVLVLPSVYEEMGSVLVEAMASGLPVVASDVGGVPQLVEDGGTGLLVPPGDVAALAAALDRLVTDDHLRARLSAGAAARAQRYAWPPLASRVADVYQRVGVGTPIRR
jgi:glycogen(starch) synthase